jgi:hypothetical protein
MPEAATAQADWKTMWKEHAIDHQLTTSTTLRVRVPRDFKLRVLAAAVKKSGKSEKEFLTAAVVAWYESHKNGKAKASDAVIQRIESAVPQPAENEAQTFVVLVGEPALKESPLARVIDTRFGLNDAGRVLAGREAILDALNLTFGSKL